MNANANRLSDNSNGEYVRLVYQSASEDIRFFKRQQWLVAYYTLLIYGAVIALIKLFKSNENQWLTYVPFFIGFLSLVLIIGLHRSTDNARNRFHKVRERLPEDLVDLLFDGPPRRYADSFDKYSVSVILIILVIAGAGLTFWVLLISRPSGPETSLISAVGTSKGGTVWNWFISYSSNIILFATLIAIIWYTLETRQLRKVQTQATKLEFRPVIVLAQEGQNNNLFVSNIGRGHAIDITYHYAIKEAEGELMNEIMDGTIDLLQKNQKQRFIDVCPTKSDKDFGKLLEANLDPRVSEFLVEIWIKYSDLVGNRYIISYFKSKDTPLTVKKVGELSKSDS